MSTAADIGFDPDLEPPAEDWAPSAPPAKPLGLPLLLGYGVGQAGAQIFRDAPSFLLPAYLSTALGVPAWMMGLVIFLPKLWIVFCDPLVGAYSDRIDTPIGRRRPFLLAGAILCPVTLVMLLNVPLFPAVWARAAYACVMFCLAMTAFSLFSVPYLALGAEISPDARQRTRVMSYRLIFVAVGLFTSIGVGQRLLVLFGGGRPGYAGAALVLGGICLASMLLCFIMVRGAPLRRRVAREAAAPAFFRQMNVARGNRPFMRLLGIHLVHLTAQSANQTVTLLFFLYVDHKPDLLFATYILNGFTIIGSQVVWLKLTKRFGKVHLLAAAVAVSAFNQLSFVFLRPDSHILLTLPIAGALTGQDMGVMARFILTGFVASGMTLLAYALFTDTVDDFSLRTGTHYEGAFAGIWSAIEKVGFAAGPLIAGAILSACGFIESTHGTQAQSPRVIQALYFNYGVLPALLLLATVPILLKLPAVMADARPAVNPAVA
jgi:GPH family glycoside/pentoside/hexuronide:cation symporter